MDNGIPCRGMALVPLRRGKQLTSDSTFKQNGVISLWDEHNKDLVIGRKELLLCLYAACGCDDNRYSTKNKCVGCETINQWALYALSRKMLRVSSEGVLQGRGKHASVLVNSTPLDISDDEWGGDVMLEVGTRISLEPAKGSGRLEFVFVLVDRATMQILDPDETDSAKAAVSKSQQSGETTRSEDATDDPASPRESHLDIQLEKETSIHTSEEVHVGNGTQSESEPSNLPCMTNSNDTVSTKEVETNPKNTNRQIERSHAIFLERHDDQSTPLCLGAPLDSRIPKSKQEGPSLASQHYGVDPALAKKEHDKKTKRSEDQKLVVYFCPLGQDLPLVRRQILSQKAKDSGATVVDNFRLATHIIISGLVSSVSQVCQRLNIQEEELKSHFDAKGVECVLPKWIAAATGKSLLKPSRADLWHGYVTKKRKRDSNRSSETKASKARRPYTRNMEVAELFKQLSSLHQSSPLLPVDSWKAYMFRIVSGRIMNLNFEISDDPDTLQRLREVKGIGSSSFDKIKEYLNTGTFSRIKEFEIDPRRVAMKNMMDIWGVGRVKASELVHRGYLTIEGVRRAIKTRKLYLDRNQLVGVDCYEDIREEMDRKEVESIGRIVEQCTQEMHPGAEVRIMGSYRRGKDTCGDVDVHITHKSYVKKIPDTALGEIVDLMWKRGHLAFHLTFLSGMKTGSTIADYQESSRYIPRDAWEGSKVVGYSSTRSSEKSSSSYMGVLKSPVVEGRRRRVDFKFYPYRERIFASLYFTGNGYFNRSMRLWAGRKFNFILNDHGLFSSGTVDRVMEASEEREVFEKLQLVYKEPVERDCFDACEPKEGIVEMEDMEITEAEFFSGNAHVWIN